MNRDKKQKLRYKVETNDNTNDNYYQLKSKKKA